MNLLDKIKASVVATGLPFNYGSAEELDKKIANSAQPATYCYLLQDSREITVGGQRCEQAQVVIFFCDRTSESIDSEENEQIISRCKEDADDWLRSIREGNELAIVGEVQYRRVYLQFYQQVTGIGVAVTLRENVGLTYC